MVKISPRRLFGQACWRIEVCLVLVGCGLAVLVVPRRAIAYLKQEFDTL